MADEETRPLVSAKEDAKLPYWKQTTKRIKLMSNYLIDDVKRGQVQFKIGIFAVFVIIAFISILVNARGLLTIMFIGITEDAVGDSDFYITSVNSQANIVGIGNNFASRFVSNFMSINDTATRLKTVDDLKGSAPRLILPGIVLNKQDSQKNTSVYAILGDSMTENAYGIGRALQVRALIGPEAYIMSTINNMAELNGQSFIFKLDILRYLRTINIINGTNTFLSDDRDLVTELIKQVLPSSFSINSSSLVNLTEGSGIPKNLIEQVPFPNITLNLTQFINPVIDALINILYTEIELKPQTILEKSKGKWPDTLGNVLFIERKFYLDYFEKNLNSSLKNLSIYITDLVLGSLETEEEKNNTANVFQDPNEIVREQLRRVVKDRLEVIFIKPINDGFNDLNIKDKAMTMCAVVKEKAKIYSSFITYKKSLISLSNRVMKALGNVDRYSLTAPMYFGYEALANLAIFIQNIIYMILVLLLILATVLLGSLMVFSIDQKTYEFGMLRALGLVKTNIVLMLIIQGTVFAICGWAFGILLSWTISIMLQISFYLDIRLDADINFDYIAWIVSVLFGFLMPIIVNVYSIRSALSNSIKDSLDLYHRTINTITVVIVKLQRLGIDRTVFLVSIELAVYGFLFYYVAPLTFFYNRLDLFIYLFNTILLASIISLTVLANIFQEYLEILLAWMCLPLIWTQRPLISVIMKNIKAHRPNNRKTSLMLTLCVCFIIFSGSGIHTQVNSIITAVILFNGADLSVTAPDSKKPLDEFNIRKFLDKPEISSMVSSYSFMAGYLDDYPTVDGTQITPKSYYPVFNGSILAVDENFTKTFYSQYYTPNSYISGGNFKNLANGRKDGLSMLFTDDNEEIQKVPLDPKGVYSKIIANESQGLVDLIKLRVVIPTGLVEFSSLNVGVPARLVVSLNGHVSVGDVTIVHTADKIPGLMFSKYVLSLMTNGQIVVSMKDYKKVLNLMKANVKANNPDAYDNFVSYENEVVQVSSFQIPKNRMLVKLADGLPAEKRDIIKNGIKNQIQTTDSLVDSQEVLETTDRALKYLQILNIMIAALTCIISFFMLLISLIKKIKDNIWELGVLRSIGLTTSQIYWIYSIETGSVIFSSLLLGTGVGLLISWISSYFYFIFFEVDLGLGFPVTEFTILVCFLLITTVLTSYVGMKRFAHLPIARLLKGLI